jgi:hypothetical protein
MLYFCNNQLVNPVKETVAVYSLQPHETHTHTKKGPCDSKMEILGVEANDVTTVSVVREFMTTITVVI